MRLVAIVSLFIGVTLGGCSSCSPQCQGERGEGCACSADQECSTRSGILLCTNGTCTAGDPPDAPGAHCTSDAQCGAGGGCGVDQICLAAPRCQRIDAAAAPLSFVASSAAASGTLTASRADCTHTWSATAGASALSVDVTIGLDGAMQVNDTGSSPSCSGGSWNAGARTGEIDCGSEKWTIGPSDALAAAGCDLTQGTCP